MDVNIKNDAPVELDPTEKQAIQDFVAQEGKQILLDNMEQGAEVRAQKLTEAFVIWLRTGQRIVSNMQKQET